MGFECDSGDYNNKELSVLEKRLYGWGGSFSNEEEVREVIKRYDELKACIEDDIGNNLKPLKEELSNSHDNKESLLNINYLDYLDKNGISPENKLIISDLWAKIGINDIKDRDLFKGFLFLLKLFTSIESDGRNIKNNNGSTAEGYFQYLTGNGSTGYEIMINGKYIEVGRDKYIQLKKSKNKIYKGKKITKFNIRHKKSSFELALYKAKKYYGNSIPEWLKKDIDSPLELSINQQTTLFLIDLFTKTKKVFNRNHDLKGMKDFLPLAINGNEWGIKKIYYVFHHTKPDEATKRRIREKINLYRSNLLALNHKTI